MSDDVYHTIYIGNGKMTEEPDSEVEYVVVPPIKDTLKNMVPIGWSWNGEFHPFKGDDDA